MSENHVILLEQTVTNNVADIRDLKEQMTHVEREVTSIRSNQMVTDQTVTHILDMLTTLKSDFRTMDVKIEDNIKDIHTDIKKSNDKMHVDQIEQLKQYKTTLWSVSGSILGSITVGVLMFLLL